jgi:hypothetical protein
MPATNEINDYQKLKEEVLNSSEIVGKIADSVISKQKEMASMEKSLVEKDPLKVYTCLDKEFTKTTEGRDYSDMIDLSLRMKDWLETGRMADKNGLMTKEFSFQDAVHVKDIHTLFKTVTSSIVLENTEPQSNVLGLYEVINNPTGAQVKFPVWSSFSSGINLLMDEVSEPNELVSNLSSFIVANSGKVGIKASVTREMLEKSLIDIYRLQLKGCGVALGRFKELQAVSNIFEVSETNVLMNNNGAANKAIGTGKTTGYAAGGVKNGTLSASDVFDIVAHAWNQGINVDTIIINPLMWRALASVGKTNMNSMIPSLPTANNSAAIRAGLASVLSPNGVKSADGVTGITSKVGNTVGSLEVNGMTFNVLTTPYAPVTKSGSQTIGGANIQGKYYGDIVFLDSSSAGYLVKEKDLYSVEEDKIFKQILETAFFESYGFASSNNSEGIYKVKNVVAQAGIDYDSMPGTLSLESINAAIPAFT